MTNFKAFCSHCMSIELESIVHKETYIYICPECPNVTLEYSSSKDVKNLADYLENHCL